MDPRPPIRHAWTAYAALLTAAVVAGEAANVVGGAFDARTPANWIMTAALLVATWGYALRRPIGAQRFWRAAFVIVLAATLLTSWPALLAGPTARAWVAGLLVALAPAFYAAWRYAYRSPDVWGARPDST